LDKPDNTKSIKDPTCVWYEEANQIPADGFRTTSQSIRSTRSKNLTEWITFNPQQESCHINEYFFPIKNSYERDDGDFLWVPSIQPDTRILHTTYKQNRFVTPQRIGVLESYKTIDLNYYKVNTLGLWGGALRGLIYPNFSVEDAIPGGGDDVFGLDYGYVNPTALVHTSFYEGDLHLDQLLYQSGLTHQGVVDILNREFRDIIGKKLIIVDSAVPELVADLRRAGFNARPTVKGADSVLKGIYRVQELNLYITKTSTDIINELQSYVWKETKDGKPIEEPVKVNDHAMDAIRYVVYTYGVKYWLKPKNLNPTTNYSNRAHSNKKTKYSLSNF
jgi:phage terminase large subunit